jgi:Leucine-rich repeat (LRR) protein
MQTWRKTGIASLRELRLGRLPEQVVDMGVGLRVLDCGDNALSTLPPQLTSLRALQRLRLSSNRLTDGAWEVVTALSQLRILDLSHNGFTSVPPSISHLIMLTVLGADDNAICEFGKGGGGASRMV